MHREVEIPPDAIERQSLETRALSAPISGMTFGPTATTASDGMAFDLCDETSQGDCYVVTASGDLDDGAAPQFDEHLEAAATSGYPMVDVDLTEATSVEPAAAHGLSSLRMHMAARGGAVALIVADDEVRALLHSSGLDLPVAIYSTLEGAFAAPQERSD